MAASEPLTPGGESGRDPGWLGVGEVASPDAGTGRWLAPLLLVLASFLSDLRAAWPDLSYYFRDFTVTFYPIRLFAAQEWRAGRWAFWNPYSNEGAFALPVLYPLDLLHVLWPAPEGVSWLLTLHLPLAALAMYVLARDLGLRQVGAFLAGATYALGGLALSSLNLYVFLQALAWAPLVVGALRRAALKGGRWIPCAALGLAVSLSTLAVEFVGQSIVLGWALGWAAGGGRKGWLRLALATVLGAGLAAVPIAIVGGILAETARGAGFDRSVALGNELHPMALLQAVISGLFGSLAFPVEQWWGGAFFTKGFPYFLSLYLGPFAPALAILGARQLPARTRGALIGLALVGFWYALGARGGLALLTADLPLFRSLRFPVKALFLPYLVVALLAGRGLDRLGNGEQWGRFGRLAAWVLVVPLGVALFLGVATPSAGGEFLRVPPQTFPSIRWFLTQECFRCALMCGLALAIAGGVGRGLRPGRASILLAGLMVADLARAGAGMNPQVDPGFFGLLPELRAEHLDSLDGERVFTYGVDRSPAFLEFLRKQMPGSGLWSFFVTRQLLSPYGNVLDRVEIAEGKDITSFLPRPPDLGPEELDPRRVGAILPRLREASVSRVLSLDSLEHEALILRTVVPLGPTGLAIRVYGVSESAPRRQVDCPSARVADLATSPTVAENVGPLVHASGRGPCARGVVSVVASWAGYERLRVEVGEAAPLIVRENYARGWKATVDGVPVRILETSGHHRAVVVPEGRHDVAFEYEPPGLGLGLALFAGSLLGILILWFRPVLAPARPGAA